MTDAPLRPPTQAAQAPAASLRLRSREALRAEIADQALALLDQRGFDATTVDDIAAAVGISSRSFFRYFATKEDLVVGDPDQSGVLLRDALVSRPAHEPPWVALRAALQTLVDATEQDPTRALRAMRVIVSTASLRARSLEKHLMWAEMLRPVMAARMGLADDDDDLPARAVVAAGITCFDVAIERWTQSHAGTPLGRLLDDVVAGVRQPPPATT